MEKIINAEKIGSYEFIHQELMKKRIEWYEKNKSKLNLQGSDVRKAFTLFLFKYLELNPKDIQVVYEDKKKIVWRSYNFCPVLEACKRLGLDTRKVCKEGWEKSVQVLIEKVNPKLKFFRNCQAIRPHVEYCEEGIELIE